MAEEAERQRQEEEAEQRRLAEAAEAERLAAEQAEAERLAAEQTASAQARRQRLLRKKEQLLQQYRESIRRVVSSKFRPPPGIRPGASCIVVATIVFPNEVVDAQVTSCSAGGNQMARAVEKAVKTANFPHPPHKAVFSRRLEFTFRQ